MATGEQGPGIFTVIFAARHRTSQSTAPGRRGFVLPRRAGRNPATVGVAIGIGVAIGSIWLSTLRLTVSSCSQIRDDTDPDLEDAPLFLPMAEQKKRTAGTAEPFSIALPALRSFGGSISLTAEIPGDAGHFLVVTTITFRPGRVIIGPPARYGG
jgi:hypothetical protein